MPTHYKGKLIPSDFWHLLEKDFTIKIDSLMPEFRKGEITDLFPNGLAKEPVIPEWCVTVEMEDSPEFDNYARPLIRYKPEMDPHKCGLDEVLWAYDDKKHLYWREHPDGRYQSHTHGPLRDKVLDKEGNWDGKSWKTAPDKGYAGRTFIINMVDGKIAHLIGPWHGAGHIGFSDVTVKSVATEKTPNPLGYFGLKLNTYKLNMLTLHFNPDWTIIRHRYLLDTGRGDKEKFEYAPRNNLFPKSVRRLELIEERSRKYRTQKNTEWLEWKEKVDEAFEEELVQCGVCQGTGEIRVLRNAWGEVDYLSGKPTGELVMCEHCNGEGFEK